MARYHINAKGEPGVCKAQHACPFGSWEDHHDTAEDARTMYEKQVSSITKYLAHAEAVVAEKEATYEAAEIAHRELVEKLRKGDATADEVKAAWAHIKVVTDELRAAVYQQFTWEKASMDKGLTEPRPKPFNTMAAKRANKLYMRTIKTKRTFKMPMSKETYRALVQEFTSWSGLPREEAKRLLRSWDKESAQTHDEYITSLFQKHVDTTRDRVYLDLETTSFHPTSGEIIEIGIVRVNPKGEIVATVDERFDMEDKVFRDTVGTGPVAVHKIHPEDIRDKETFRSPAVQARIAEHLNDPNVIVVAHNANFENAWLDHNLDGYYEAHNPDSADLIVNKEEPARIQDTRNLAMFLGHSLPNTKLESFSQGNGVPYVDSHSAFPDAEMTWKAFEAFRGRVVAAPEGQRPEADVFVKS